MFTFRRLRRSVRHWISCECWRLGDCRRCIRKWLLLEKFGGNRA